jgi:cell division septation protein DedD
MMSRIESNGGLNGPAFQNEDRLSPPTVRREVSPAVAPAVERQDSLPRRDATQPDKDAPVLAMLVDPSGGGYGRYGMGSSTLRAGMHLVKDMRAPSDILPPATSPAKQAPPGDGSPQAKASKKPESPPTASPEITRESILDDLLREMSGAVL